MRLPFQHPRVDRLWFYARGKRSRLIHLLIDKQLLRAKFPPHYRQDRNRNQNQNPFVSADPTILFAIHYRISAWGSPPHFHRSPSPSLFEFSPRSSATVRT